MLLHNYMKVFLHDLIKSSWKIGICFAIVIVGVVTFGSFSSWLNNPETIPDVFDQLFQKGTFYMLTIPLFLVVLSFVLPSIMDPLRFVRFYDRKKVAVTIIFTVVIVVIAFLVTYFITGYLYGWWLGGSLENTWATTEGKPFIQSRGEVDLSLFTTGYMFLRYILTEFFAFLVIGLFAAFLYLLIPRFSLVFLVVEGVTLFDASLLSLTQFTFFLGKAVVGLGNWGTVSTFIGHLLYFFGLIVVFSVGIYVMTMKRDIVPISEEKA